MKTTLELPDELMRAVKIRAAQSDRKLKDVIEELIRRGLAEETPPPQADLAQFAGAFPNYKTMEEVVAYVRDLRQDRDAV